MIAPLTGVKVVDFTQGYAGPMCTFQLGLLGAEVLKIERPATGDTFRERGRIFDAVNAGKRSTELDIKDAGAAERVRALIADTDIVVHNFRASVSAGLGLEADDVFAVNPDVVLCAVSGYGRRGDWADTPAIEWTAQAATGLMDTYVDVDDRQQHGVLLLDPFTGILATQSILAAWLERQRTGEGQFVDVSLLDTALIAQSSAVPAAVAGDPPPRMEERMGVGRFRTADGAVYIGAVPYEWQRRLFRVLRIDIAELDAIREDQDRIEKMRGLIEAAAQKWQAADLAREVNALGVPAAVVETLPDVFAPSHPLRAHISLETTEDMEGAPLQVVGSAVRFNGASLGPRAGTPRLGEYDRAGHGDI